jgi:hypothetical protein
VTINSQQESELINMKARALALQDSLEELKARNQSGYLADGQYFALRSTMDAERRALIARLQVIFAGKDDDFDAVLNAAANNADEADVRSQLAEVAEKKGWAKRVVGQINEHKGTIVTWLVDIGLGIAKQAASP